MNKVALIFGISGQDGAYLAQFLLSKGYIIHGTSRDAEINSFSSLKEIGIKDNIIFHSVALNDFKSTLKVIEEVEPNEIYNLAGQSSVGLSFEQPMETLESITNATINILESIKFLGGTSLFYSAGSSECFGDTFGNPADETTPMCPKNPYGVAKTAAYWTVLNYRESYNLYACSGITFNHESILRPSRFVTRKICKSAAKIALGNSEFLKLGDLSISRDWGWAPEYVEAMWKMLQQNKPEDFVISTGKLSKLSEFVNYAFLALGLDWKKYIIYDEKLVRPYEIKSGYGSSKKAKEKLNWSAETMMQEVAYNMAINEFNRQKIFYKK